MKLSSRTSGFTLVEIMIAVSIIGLLAAVAIPNFIKSRELTHRKVCVANLKQIEGAVQSWAVFARKGNGDAITPHLTEIMGPNGFVKHHVVCPVGGNYNYGKVGDPRHVYCTLSDSPDYHTLW